MAMLVGCKACGHEFEEDNWAPGFSCPECNSTETELRGSVKHEEPDAEPHEEGIETTWSQKDEVTAAPGWKNSPLVGGIAIAAIVLTWVLLGTWTFKKPKRERMEAVTMCVECGAKSEHFTDEIPAKCDKCGKKTVYRTYQCSGTKDKECSHMFTFIPPEPPKDLYSRENYEELSDEERMKLESKSMVGMMEYEQALMEAQKCPECGSHNTMAVYTEAQKKKFEEWRSKRKKKKKKRKKE